MHDNEHRVQQNLSKHGLSVTGVPAISYQTIIIFIWVCYTIVCQGVVVFGVVANVLNIICFVKQGINDPMNISLMGLAISDLGCLIPQVCINIVLTPAFSEQDLPFDAMGVFYLVSAVPHFTFTRVTSWITAIITLERCLSVIAPLKVKTIVTPKRVTIIIVGVFLLLVPAEAPVYVVNTLGMTFNPYRNKTVFGLIFRPDKERVEKLQFAINNFFLPFAAFGVIIVCTTILVINLQKMAKWREASMSCTNSDVSNRSQRVVKMVVMISTLFISCFVPATIILLAVSFEPSFSAGGKNIYIGIVVGGIGVLLECINSSVNIFIYYHMSSKYRSTFRSIFCNCKALTGKTALLSMSGKRTFATLSHAE